MSKTDIKALHECDFAISISKKDKETNDITTFRLLKYPKGLTESKPADWVALGEYLKVLQSKTVKSGIPLVTAGQYIDRVISEGVEDIKGEIERRIREESKEDNTNNK